MSRFLSINSLNEQLREFGLWFCTFDPESLDFGGAVYWEAGGNVASLGKRFPNPPTSPPLLWAKVQSPLIRAPINLGFPYSLPGSHSVAPTMSVTYVPATVLTQGFCRFPTPLLPGFGALTTPLLLGSRFPGGGRRESPQGSN